MSEIAHSRDIHPLIIFYFKIINGCIDFYRKRFRYKFYYKKEFVTKSFL